jgi:rhamnose utilization protein RhaD (predicted bifunctional aldolase and dehydrogenase)
MTTEMRPSDHLAEIVKFSRAIGDPQRDLVILAEGNTSVRSGENRMLVKASGSNLMTAASQDFVEVNLSVFMGLITSGPASDDDVAEMLTRATIQGSRRPSVESLLHAVCMQVPGVNAVAHTHPTPVNALLCSDQASYLQHGSMFPDQIVVMGQHPLMIPYIDPGLPLAQDVLARLGAHAREHGSPPKVIYLLNHGMFALGTNTEEALQITSMAVKSARVMLGALSAGTPTFLTPENAHRIDTRPDEELRRQLLASLLP